MAQAISFENIVGVGTYLYPTPYFTNLVRLSSRDVYKRKFLNSSEDYHFLEDNEIIFNGNIVFGHHVAANTTLSPEQKEETDRYEFINEQKNILDSVFDNTHVIVIQDTKDGSEAFKLEKVFLKSFDFDSNIGANTSSYTAVFGYSYTYGDAQSPEGSGIYRLSDYSISESLEEVEGFFGYEIANESPEVTAKSRLSYSQIDPDYTVYKLTLTEKAIANPSQRKIISITERENPATIAKKIIDNQPFIRSNITTIYQNCLNALPSSVLLFPQYSSSLDTSEGSFTRTTTSYVAPIGSNSIVKINPELSRNNTDFSTINLSCDCISSSGFKPLDFRYSFFENFAKYEIAQDYDKRHDLSQDNPLVNHFSDNGRKIKLLNLGSSVTSNDIKHLGGPPPDNYWPFVYEKCSFSWQETRGRHNVVFTNNALSEVSKWSINITDISPGDLFSETLLIGSSQTALQDSYARSEYRKILEVTFTAKDRSKHFPETFANEVLLQHSPIAVNGATKCFVEPIQQSYNPKTLAGSFTINWIYEI